MLDLNGIVWQAQQQNASDVHIVNGLPLKCRIDGEIKNLSDDIVDFEACEALAKEIAGERYEEMRTTGELDKALTMPCGIRVRINAFRARGSVSFAVRLLSDTIPEIEELELPAVAVKLPSYPSGLVLITGETGSGKSTTLAAVLNRINHTACKHIVTLEDPIEYVYIPDKCIINQREIGQDTASYADGLRAILREDPDVILVGEMRDLETISTAITAAETGHLVFSTLHTIGADKTIDRIIDVFPPNQQQQIRIQLASVLECVVSQQLLKKADGSGRVAALEILFANNAVRNLIRESKTYQISSVMQTNRRAGMQTMDDALYDLYMRKLIDGDNAVTYAQDPVSMNKKVSFDF